MILILLSTYNGEKYLQAQLDSILSQTIHDWVLLIRDDGSTDKTLSIIQHYTKKDPRIQCLPDQLGNLKPPQSFSTLMQHALERTQPFIFFADQDDVWQKDKLEKSVLLLQKMTSQYSDKTPLMVFSDLRVVDADLKTIHPSYLTYEKLTPTTQNPLKKLLVHNYITGCTVGMNKALLTIATPLSKESLMHDWWAALFAATHGHIGFIPESTLLYRQHGKNDTGSRGFYGKFRFKGSFKSFLQKRREQFLSRFAQAERLLARLDPSHPDYDDIQQFSQLPKLPRLSRLWTAWQLNLNIDGFLRKLGFYLMLLI